MSRSTVAEESRGNGDARGAGPVATSQELTSGVESWGSSSTVGASSLSRHCYCGSPTIVSGTDDGQMDKVEVVLTEYIITPSLFPALAAAILDPQNRIHHSLHQQPYWEGPLRAIEAHLNNPYRTDMDIALEVERTVTLADNLARLATVSLETSS